ncbi:MAG: TrmH family RNA methyltransferase, partial [Geminicoccaceae bacterium]
SGWSMLMMRSRSWSVTPKNRSRAWKAHPRRSASAFDRTGARAIETEATVADRALIERCRRARRDDRLVVLEGLHALKHALRFGAEIEGAYSADPKQLNRLAESLAPDVAARIEGLVETVSPEVFADLAPNAPETGVLALAARPKTTIAEVNSPMTDAPIIMLEAPAHLVNVGAVIRAAAAAGAGAVLSTGHHDPWDPAAVRGSAGLHFAQPVVHCREMPAFDRPLIAIDPEGEPLDPKALPARTVFAFGSERRGLSSCLLERADQRLAIPMEPNVSSLNLATAVAVVLYGWRLSWMS